MHSTSVTPWQSYCCSYSPIPHSHRFSSLKSLPLRPIAAARLTLSTDNDNRIRHRNRRDPDRENPLIPQDFHFSVEKQDTHFGEDDEEPERPLRSRWGILSNMWWADMKAALGQRINVEGVAFSLGIFAKNRHLVIPHVAVPDIRYIDWAELKMRGFEGVVFDKDNTITVPYSLRLYSPLRAPIEQCKALFGNNIAVFSNSAGLSEYDPDGRNAKILERAIGIKVIRHKLKKPAGTAEEIERQFGCESSKLIMVGDRPFTDIVYGNRNGFLTILTEPLSVGEEPFIVKQVRVIERAIVNRWSKKGLKPISHKLLPNCEQCIKDRPM